MLKGAARVTLRSLLLLTWLEPFGNSTEIRAVSGDVS